MKLSEALKFILKSPIAVIKDGIWVQKNKELLVEQKHPIKRLPTIDWLDLLPSQDLTINCYSFLAGTSLATDMILLKALAGKFEDCIYLEIGSWRGESITNVSEVAKECVSVTLGPDHMRELGINENFIKVHGAFSKGIKNITTIEENSLSFDFKELKKKFDLIFIDGDHSYSGVLNDTQKIFELRKSDDSIIVWHDYSSDTEDVRVDVLEAILDGIPKEKHKNLFHISNTMCAVYMEKNVLTTKVLDSSNFPNKKFTLKVKAERFN